MTLRAAFSCSLPPFFNRCQFPPNLTIIRKILKPDFKLPKHVNKSPDPRRFVGTTFPDVFLLEPVEEARSLNLLYGDKTRLSSSFLDLLRVICKGELDWSREMPALLRPWHGNTLNFLGERKGPA